MLGRLLRHHAQSARAAVRCEFPLMRLAAAAMLAGAVSVGVAAQSEFFTSIPEIDPSRAWLTEAPLDPSLRATVEQAVKGRQYDRAEALILEQHNINPNSSPLLVVLGNIFFLDRQFLNCAIAMKKADALTPLGERNRFVLAMAYISLGHGDWARPEIQKLAQQHPNNAVYPYWLSRLAYHDMHLVEAAADVERAIQLNPRFMKAYDNLGLYDEGLGKQDEAIEAYHRAIQLNHENGLHSPWPACNLGALLNKLDRLDEAEAYLTEALKEAPSFSQAHFLLGLLLEKCTKDAEARELRKAMASDPSYAEPYFILGKILQREHKSQEAQEAFDTFRRLKSSAQAREVSE